MTPFETLTQRGFCIDEWERWHQGQCGTYALALMSLNPTLRLGMCGDLEDGEFFVWAHAFAHDDEFAYDAGGRHALPYKGAWGTHVHQELDQYPDDYNLAYEESGPEGEQVNLDAAVAHILRNDILNGRYTTTLGPTLGNRRSRCRFCGVVIAPQGGPWVDAVTRSSCCEIRGALHPHEPTSNRWKVSST